LALDVVIVDSGGANFASLTFAFERLGVHARISREPKSLAAASHIVLPGVGAAANAMRRLESTGLAAAITRLTQPVLGICLGMQLLFRDSEEGPTDCLGVLPDTVRRIHGARGRPVPHMGWNQVKPDREDPLLDGIGPDDYAYFVHSYAALVSPDTVAHTEYGKPLSAVVRRGNFCGTQFHPERSGKTGARLLENFLRL
jgi:imidazole glycerol-phosphate synthase subunit HisH